MLRNSDHQICTMEPFEARRLMSGDALTAGASTEELEMQPTVLLQRLANPGLPTAEPAPGGTDSIWIDLGAPVQETSSIGTGYSFARDGKSSGL